MIDLKTLTFDGARSYATRDNAVKTLLKLNQLGIEGRVVTLVATNPEGRFVPVFLPAQDQCHWLRPVADLGIYVLRV